ncbi:MAG: hypothetical protein K6G92_00685 [Bacteroidaceae bacterium]|nr:hypothetical protein [Bacteroidaceae bacterium]
MKKFFLMSTLLLAALLVNAQVKVSPKMEKGMKKTYVVEAVTTVANQKPITLTTETQYEVKDATADGYVLDIVMSSIKTDADQNDQMGRIFSLSTEIMKDIHTTYATDKDGKVTKILNYEEIKNKAGKGIDKLLAEVPMPASLTKEMLKEQIMNNISEESLLQSLQANTSPLTMIGKTITTGLQDEFKNGQGMNLKRTYTVNDDGTIQTTSTMDLSKEELKQLVIAQVEKLMPSQAETLKQNIDMVLNSGMMKMEIKENATFTLTADGWVNSITSELNYNTMGAVTTAKTTVRLKN